MWTHGSNNPSLQQKKSKATNENSGQEAIFSMVWFSKIKMWHTVGLNHPGLFFAHQCVAAPPPAAITSDRLAIAARAAWLDFLARFQRRAFVVFRACVAAVARLDCLLALVRVALLPDYCRPEFVDERACDRGSSSSGDSGNADTSGGSGVSGIDSRIRQQHRRLLHISGGRHPVMESLVAQRGGCYVPIDIELSSTAHDDDCDEDERADDGGDECDQTADHASYPTSDPASDRASDASAPPPRCILLTGANMGGKSSAMRTCASLVVLAHIGAHVPARAMRLTAFDAVHVRAGASDDVAHGRSTFMVELCETARILRAATFRSLVLLDELGRGTSTHDGAAIAHAVLDHLVRRTRCFTLFATHYPALGAMARSRAVRPRGAVANMHMAYLEEDGGAAEATAAASSATSAAASRHASDDSSSSSLVSSSSASSSSSSSSSSPPATARPPPRIVFLYALARGLCPHSFGLNVARMAGLPPSVVARAAVLADRLRSANQASRVLSASFSSRRPRSVPLPLMGATACDTDATAAAAANANVNGNAALIGVMRAALRGDATAVRAALNQWR